MPAPIDLTGRVFSRLTVVSQAENSGRDRMWNCVCSCGELRKVRTASLLRGMSRSCGCYKREVTGNRRRTHGRSARLGERTYSTWRGMLERCSNANHVRYDIYGGRGIAVCDRWRQSFDNFLADMGERPEGTSIDRIDSNVGYQPGNCRWATHTEQSRNRNYVKLTLDLAHEIHGRHEHGETKASIARRMGIGETTVSNVLAGRTWKEAACPVF